MSAPVDMRPPPPLAKRLAVLLTLFVLAALGVALLLRIGQAMQEQAALEAERQAAAEAAAGAARVEFVLPQPAEAAPVVVLTGTLEPAQAADLAFEVPGRVARVEVALGARVRAGDVLVALDRTSVGAQSAQTSAAIAVAQANVDMLRDRVELLTGLARSGTVPERELTTAQQQLAVAEAQLAQAQASRRQIAVTSADHVLRAPFDGVVTRVPSGVGVVASPGVPLVRVEDLSSLRLRTTVNQAELEVIEIGMPVSLEGSGAQGTLRSVVRSLDAQTRRAPVEVHVPNEDGSLVANAFVRARIAVGRTRRALRIPATSRRPNGTVFVLGEGDRVEVREVAAEADVDGSWLVTDGLSESDRVVLRPAATRPGVVVSPVQREPETTTAALEP
ncbi:MAG TPA: efflux RND transporter periplasmic adaptor subunit [Sandaracinaceae bacterium]